MDNNKKQGRPPTRAESRNINMTIRVGQQERHRLKEAQQLTGMTLADVLTAWANKVLKNDKKRQ